MAGTLTRIASLHQALWNLDGWYRRAWFVWPQALSLLAGVLVFSSGEPSAPRPAAAPWVKPVAAATPAPPSAPAPPSEDSQLCNNVFADAKQRGAACDRLIQTGKLAGAELATAYFGRAWMHQLASQFDAAIADYSESIKLNPKNYIAYNGRGWMYVNKNDLDKALQDFNQSIDINRANVNALAFANRAEVRRRQGKLSEALADVSEALRLNDKLEMAILVRNGIQADLKRLEEAAKKPPPAQTSEAPPAPPRAPPASPSAEAPARQPPASAGAAAPARKPSGGADPVAERRARALASLQKGDYDGAIAEFTQIIQGEGVGSADFEGRSAAYAGKKQHDLAIADLTRAIGFALHGWEPHARRAELYAMRGDNDRAISDLNAAINDHKADNARVFFQRGDVNLRRDDYDLAWDDFNKVIERAPDAPEGYLGRGLAHARKMHALINFCAGRQPNQSRTLDGGPCARPIDFEPAIEDLRNALKRKPTLGLAHYEIGRIMAQRNRWEDAVQAYTDAIRANPNDALAYNNRGVAYNKLKKKELAFVDFNEAIRLDQRVAAAWVNRGDMFAESGRRQQAISDYRKALDIDSKFAPALERLKRLGIRL